MKCEICKERVGVEGRMFLWLEDKIEHYHKSCYDKSISESVFKSSKVFYEEKDIERFDFTKPQAEVSPQESKPSEEKVTYGVEDTKCDKCKIRKIAVTKYGIKECDYCRKRYPLTVNDFHPITTEPPAESTEEGTVTTTWADTSGGSGKGEFKYKIPKGVHIYNTPSMQESAESTEVEEIEELDMDFSNGYDSLINKLEKKSNELVRGFNRLAKEIKLRKGG